MELHISGRRAYHNTVPCNLSGMCLTYCNGLSLKCKKMVILHRHAMTLYLEVKLGSSHWIFLAERRGRVADLYGRLKLLYSSQKYVSPLYWEALSASWLCFSTPSVSSIDDIVSSFTLCFSISVYMNVKSHAMFYLFSFPSVHPQHTHTNTHMFP